MAHLYPAFFYFTFLGLFYFFTKNYFGKGLAILMGLLCIVLPKPTFELLLSNPFLSLNAFAQFALVFAFLKLYEREKSLDFALVLLGIPFGFGCGYSPSFSFFFIALWVLIFVSRSKTQLGLFTSTFACGLLISKFFSPWAEHLYPYGRSLSFENFSKKIETLLLFGETTHWLHYLAILTYCFIFMYVASILMMPKAKYKHCPSEAEERGAPPSELFMIYLACFFVFLMTTRTMDSTSNLTFYFNLVILICYGLHKMHDHHKHPLLQGPSFTYGLFLILNLLSYFKF